MPVSQVEELSKKSSTLVAAQTEYCIFYKKDSCSRNKLKYPICKKCHRNRVITMENAVPRLFERIIAMANLLIKVMGITPSK